MASRKSHRPLAEVRAAVKTVRRSRAKQGEHDRPGPYTMTWDVDPEDVAIVDAFLNGPMAGHQIVLRFLTLEQGWTAPRCDPNVTPEEAVADDELARLRRQYVQLMQSDGTDEAPAPDSLTG